MGHLGLPFGTPRGRVGTPRSGPDSNGGVVGSSRPRVLFDQSEMVCRSRPTRGRVTAAGQAARVPAPEGPAGGPFTFIQEVEVDRTTTYRLGSKRGRGFDAFYPAPRDGPSMSDDDYRVEEDSLGEMKVPGDAYWGAQTQRAVENFPKIGRASCRERV